MGKQDRVVLFDNATEAGREGEELDLSARADQVEELTRRVLKAAVEAATPVVPASRAFRDGDDQSSYLDKVIEPPYDKAGLIRVKEQSNALPQVVDAMAQNVDGFGHSLRAVIDFNKPESNQAVADLLTRARERWKSAAAHLDEKPAFPFGLAFDVDADPVPEPSKEEVEKLHRELRTEAQREKDALSAFFRFANAETSFEDFRIEHRKDLEVTGDSFWEVLRDDRGQITEFSLVPAHTVKLTRCDEAATEFEEHVRISPKEWRTQRRSRRFRRFVQRVGTERVFFKEFRDPRPIDRESGAVLAFTRDAEGKPVPLDAKAKLANEVIHWRLRAHGQSPYGTPRWIGVLLETLGSRQAGEINYMHFSNKGLPRGILVVEGGSFGDGAVERIKEFCRTEIKGKLNYEKFLILEALVESESEPGSAPRVQWIDLSGAIQSDALFQNYDERNTIKTFSAFRIPKLFLAMEKDFQKATAAILGQITDQQVFATERRRFDEFLNRFVLPDLGIDFWEFQSRGMPLSDPETVANVIGTFVNAGALTPMDVRSKAAEALDLILEKPNELLAAIPPKSLPAIIQNLPPEVVLELFGVDVEAIAQKRRGRKVDPSGAADTSEKSGDLPEWTEADLKDEAKRGAILLHASLQLGKLIDAVRAMRAPVGAAGN